MSEEKHAGGRPTKYNDKMVTRAEDYLASCVSEVEDYVKTSGDKSTTYQRIVTANLPKMCGLAVCLKVNKSTLYEWAEKNPKFSDVLDDIKEKKEDILLEGGLSGDFNPLITKLILSSRHEYREKSDVTSDGESIQPVLVQFTDGKEKDNNNS